MLVALFAPAASHAKTQVITFDDLPLHTELTDQYKDRGIVFGLEYSESSKTFFEASSDHRPVVDDAGPFGQPPRSAPHGATTFCQCNEFPHSVAAARLTYTTPYVSLWTYGGASLSVYDVNQKLLKTVEQTSGEGWRELRVDRAKADIAYFQIDPGRYMVDDISFEVPDDPSQAPPPDFNVTLDLNGFFGAPAITQGGTIQIPIRFSRFNGSAGPIDLSVDLLPSGVQSSLEPDPAPGDSSVLRLHAPEGTPAVENQQVRVTATEGGITKTAHFRLNVIGRYDARIVGIDILQAVQREHEVCHAFSNDPMTPLTLEEQRSNCTKMASLPPRTDLAAPMPYNGVEMVRNSRTIVRVFANTQPGSDSPPHLVELRGFRGGKELAGGPLLPEEGPRVLRPGSPVVSLARRADPEAAFTFTLPPAWTKAGGLSLKATLVEQDDPILYPQSECTTSQCALNNTMTLAGIPFVNTGELWLGTARLWTKKENLEPGRAIGYYLPGKDLHPSRWPLPRDVFSFLEAVLPLADGALRFNRTQWYGQIDVSDVLDEYPDKGTEDERKEAADDRKDEVRSRLDDYADDAKGGCADRELCGDIVIGVHGPEITTGGVMYGYMHHDFWDPVGVGTWSRPDSVAHEVMHGFGRWHSHGVETCGDKSGNTQLGSGPELVDGSGWGFVQGVGIDRRLPDLPGNGRYQTVASFALGGPRLQSYPPVAVSDYTPFVFDNMSYCRPGRDPRGSWTAPEGWRRNLQWLRMQHESKGKAAAATASIAASQRTLRVLAVASTASGVQIQAVKPGFREKVPAGGSTYVLRAVGAAGQTLAEAPLAAIDVADGVPGEQALKGEVPAAGAAGVAIVRDGTVVATRTASPSAPKVRILSPRRKATVGRGATVTVRWRATDADGGELRAKVDYSFDDGRTWRPIALEPSENGVRLPSTLFAGSRRARVRVRVNDGFREAVAVSRRFRAVGRKPTVEILAPAARAQIRNSAALYLSGTASDDRGKAIRGKRLRWFAGKRRIGRGERTTVSGLPAGTRTIRLVARDRSGRKATARVKVKVLGDAPRFLRVDAPKTLAPSSKRLVLRVATTVPARLRIGRQTFRVSRRARRVRVKVKRGTAPLALTLALSAGKARIELPLSVPRG
ncbi:MAG TPA: hypothetical protein VM266_15510 [Solirubrobacteraceae bacterium]|nr:hypothetical protein [Solirubrobacteraceae bacterium]